jgi:hypothetical protein
MADDDTLTATIRQAEIERARLRLSKVAPAVDALSGLAGSIPDLIALRSDLHDGGARRALDAVISMLTSAPGMATAEMADLRALIPAEEGDAA